MNIIIDTPYHIPRQGIVVQPQHELLRYSGRAWAGGQGLAGTCHQVHGRGLAQPHGNLPLGHVRELYLQQQQHHLTLTHPMVSQTNTLTIIGASHRYAVHNNGALPHIVTN